MCVYDQDVVLWLRKGYWGAEAVAILLFRVDSRFEIRNSRFEIQSEVK